MELTYEQAKELLTMATNLATIKANAAQVTDLTDLHQSDDVDQPAMTATVAAFDGTIERQGRAVNVLTDDDLQRMSSITTNHMGKDSPHAKAFGAYIAGGMDALTPEQKRLTISRTNGLGQVSKTALVEGTGANGGFLVPVEYSNEIVEPLRRDSVFRRSGVGTRTLTIKNAISLKVPTQTDSAAATVIAEEGTFTESDPTFGQISFDPIKYMKLSKVSDEMLEDSPIDLFSQVLAPDFAQAFAAAENAGFATGAGTVNVIPLGITVGSTAGVTAASGTAITSDELINLYHALSDLHRASTTACWMMNDTTVGLIHKLKDGAGRYLWQDAITEMEPARLLGHKVIINPSMPAPTTGLIPIVFGDFRYYWISDFNSSEIRILRLNELYAVTGQVGFRAYKRLDGNVMKATAFYRLTMG